MKNISYEDLIKEKGYILIDVRTPKEFEAEGIPGSVNIPILLDEERVVVGTSYKQISPEQAKIEGVKYFSERLPEIFEQVNKISKQCRRIVFYCARGGMRSGTMTAFFGALGYKVSKLEGGYRNYREFINREIPKLNEGVEYIIIHGKTGVGKTKLLNGLEERGYSVLDLERLADHKGSFFGALCEKRPQSQKRFESLVYEFFRNKSPKYVIAESESKRIGNVYVPDSIYHSLLKGRHVLAETTKELRVKVAMEDYFTTTTNEEIGECMMKVKRYVTQELADEFFELLNQGKREELAERLMDDYYDALYQKSIDKYDFKEVVKYENIEEGVEGLIKLLGL
ncbi:MAG: tRNA 2-selenouridine(34) synthase MnmH, partial [Fusobacteriaceae bacterium]